MSVDDFSDPASRARGRFFLGRLLLTQAAAAATTAGAAVLAIGMTDWVPSVPVLLVFDTTVAATIARFLLKMPLRWQVAQAALPLAAGVVSALDVPAWVWLAAFILLALIYWNSPTGRVPLFLTNRQTYDSLAELLPTREKFNFADLGSGLGGLVFALAHSRPDGTFVGFESAPLPYLISKLRGVMSRRANAQILFADFRKRDLSRFDAVYCFLSPAPMPDVFAKAAKEMRPGTRLISNSFSVPGHPPDRVVDVNDRRCTKLHVWTMPEIRPTAG
jgi:hypothetical protein